MDIVYAKGNATVNDVMHGLSDAPTRTSVRTLLRILEQKGHVKHEERGREFLYSPTQPRERAGRSAFQGLLQTFFGGSLEKALASYLADPSSAVSPDELKRLSALIREARTREDTL